MIHRKLAASELTLHTYLRGDSMSARSGEELDAAVTLLPLSVLLPKGFQLRILLAAADEKEFPGAAYSATIDPSSRLELPLKRRSDGPAATPLEPPPSTSKPNFTGTWALDLMQSDFSDPHASTPDSLLRTIQQKGDSLNYKVERQQKGRKSEFQVDLKVGGRGFESNQAGAVTAQWEGETLAVRTIFNPGSDRQAEQMERWTLQPDGKRMTDNVSVHLADGTEIKIRRVFVRQ
jgi:hypothetical protein